MALFAVFAAILSAIALADQIGTYKSKFQPLELETNNGITATPFFSPDYSALTTVELVDNALVSVDIFTPSYGTWLQSCKVPADSNVTATCVGCEPSITRADPFPMFGAILNAVHRGVAVRILTNNFDDVDCDGLISALSFLVLNGVEVKYYTSTSFMHAKYMAVDGNVVSISSVNWSKTSYTLNREAGIVFKGKSQFIYDFTEAVFDADWNQAESLQVTQKYTSAQMAVITDTSKITVTIPPPPTNPKMYITSKPSPISLPTNTPIYVSTSPDFALNQLHYDIGNASYSFQIYIYELSDEGLCDEILDIHNKGIIVTMLVSYRINSVSSCEEAKSCYAKLYDAGVGIKMSANYYTFSHQKYWIVDDARLSWSTGNWADTDYPTGNSFPPYGQSGYKPANRDFTGTLINAEIAEIFANVMNEDAIRGVTYTPGSSDITCGF